MKRQRVRIFLGPPPVEHRRQVRAAAEPCFGGDDEAGVHVHRRHVRIAQMRDQRDARGPEPGIVGRARNLRAEFRREFAMHGRAVHADLLEQPPAHHRHHAAAAGLAGVVGAVPGRAHEAPGVARIERAGASSSSLSNAAQMSSRKASNQLRARVLRSSITDMSIRNSRSLFRHCERCEAIDRASRRIRISSLRAPRNDGSTPAGRNTCSSRCNCRGAR